jgi:phosphatidylglycerophosphate synthase
MSGRSIGDVVAELSRAQKPSAGTPAYSRFINRRIGRYLAAGAFLAGRTPNQVSLTSGFCSLAGIVLMAVLEPTIPLAIGVTALLVLGYAFDSADGQLARLRGGGSPAGEWLDHVVDSVKTSALHLAVLIGWYRSDDHSERSLLVPVAFTLVAAVFFFVQILTDQLRRAHPAQAPSPADPGLRGTLRSLAVWPTDYGVLCLIFLLWAWTDGFLVVYTVMLLGTAAFMLLALPKWYREAASFGREVS